VAVVKVRRTKATRVGKRVVRKGGSESWRITSAGKATAAAVRRRRSAAPRPSSVIVRAAYDDDAGVWFIESSSLPGLRAEADSLEALRARLPGLVEDLIELNRVDLHGNVAIEVIARAHAVAHAAA
jgi:hypothetical protein